MPRVITIYKQCTHHGIDGMLIKRLHFTDLQVLIMSLDIAELRHTLKQMSKAKQQSRGVNVKDISQTDAVKFLKGSSV